MRKQNKFIFISFLMCNVFVVASASKQLDRDVKFPDEKILKDRLGRAISLHFVEKTGIVDTLLDGPKCANGVALAVELAFVDYEENCNKSMPQNRAEMTMKLLRDLKPLIYEKLLQDDPAALEELRKNGIYKPIQQKSGPASPAAVENKKIKSSTKSESTTSGCTLLSCISAGLLFEVSGSSIQPVTTPLSTASNDLAQAMFAAQQRLTLLENEVRKEEIANRNAHQAFCQKITDENTTAQKEALVHSAEKSRSSFSRDASSSSHSGGGSSHSIDGSSGRDARDRSDYKGGSAERSSGGRSSDWTWSRDSHGNSHGARSGGNDLWGH